jgi:hypothetical protein
MRRSGSRGAVAIGLVLIGLVSLGLWRVIGGSEHEAFAPGATPPESSKVTSGHSYSLAVPGGVQAMLRHGIQTVNGQNGSTLGLTCEWSVDGSANQALTVSVESLDTKAETKVATFTAPVTGDLSVSCDGWGRMFIPDADSSSGDPSGIFLLLSIIALTLGGALGLSAMYKASLERASLERAPSDQDTIQ